MSQIQSAEFVGSYTDFRNCPNPTLPEYAFIGRSNVGKSSLINMLCEQPGLAHVSQKPGKTQMINTFNINKTWYLTDLPGYGYAKTPKDIRGQWGKMIQDYLALRPNLMSAFLLVDSCIPPQRKDLDFAGWMGESQVPFALVFTKIDRKKSRQNESFFSDFKAAFLEEWEALPPHFFTSSETHEGRSELLQYIAELNTQFQPISQ